MSQTSGLTVRQFEREAISLPAELIVCDEHADQVKFSSSSSAIGQRVVKARAVDVSSGGMGLESHSFLPRMCECTLRVMEPPTPGQSDASLVPRVAFEHRVKVRRVYLTQCDPLYALGVAFVDAHADIEERVEELRRRLRRGLRAEALTGGGTHA